MYFWFLCCKLIDHLCVSLFLGSVFYSIDLCVCFSARIILFQFIHLITCCAVLSCFSPVPLSATPWTVAPQAPLSMEFSRQEYWSGLPCLLPGDPPNPGTAPRSPALQVDFLLSYPPGIDNYAVLIDTAL